MEHVEPEFVGAVLRSIRFLALKKAFFVISLRPADKVLADGRNAHLSLHPAEWWGAQLKDAGFAIKYQSRPNESQNMVWMICE